MIDIANIWIKSSILILCYIFYFISPIKIEWWWCVYLVVILVFVLWIKLMNYFQNNNNSIKRVLGILYCVIVNIFDVKVINIVGYFRSLY